MGDIVVVPTYCEAESISGFLDQLLAAQPGRVLVVDDNSPDGTQDLVRSHPGFGSRIDVLARPGKAGLGAAYRAGFQWALDHGYERIVQMDADLSHAPADVPRLLAALDDGADVAIGSRYVPGGATRNWPWSRRFISSAGNVYVNAVLGLGIRDATAGFRAWTAAALGRIGALDSTSTGYGFQIENAWRAHRRGLQITEVPITFTERAVGASKMTWRIAAEAVRSVLVWRFRELRG